MSEIIAFSGQSRCKRCGKWFTPRKEGQEYGPTCEAIMQKRRAAVIEVRNKKGELTAVIV